MLFLPQHHPSDKADYLNREPEIKESVGVQIKWTEIRLILLCVFTISSSSTRSCLRHFRDTRCSLASCSVSFLTVVLRQMTTSTLQGDGHNGLS